jgi:glycosyltransferase involved in cell wall biosynthesis
MKILMQSRVSLFSVPGGDTIQIIKTKEYLEKLGVKVDVSTELEPDVRDYDLIHLFNLTRPQEVYLQAKNAKKQGKIVLLSPIYLSYIEYDRTCRNSLVKTLANVLKPEQFEYLKICGRAVKNKELHKGTAILLVKGYKRLQKKILGLVDVFLPNSNSEMNKLVVDFNLAFKKYFKIPNAIDSNLFRDNGTVVIDEELKKFQNCILCVARIEGIKNQLNVVRAINRLPYKLVLIGKVAPNHRRYFNQIKKEAYDNIYILGEVEHNLLPKFYSLAKVHVLASWFETTGLSSLEAGAMGCNLVITDKGYTVEYFGDYAFYCRPDSVDSIREAIIRAYESPTSPELRSHILNNYTWEITAKKTLQAYEEVLKGK